MPKATFLNLPDEKRERILAVAYREFALHDYDQASLSRIVAELGIAKGSIYQYFQDKRDLYRYLLEQASVEKLTYIQDAVEAGGERDFFESQRLLMLAGARFDLSFPHLSLIIYRAMRESADPEQAAVADELTLRSADFLQRYLAAAAEREEIRTDIDIELAAHVVNSLTLALEPFLRVKYGYSHLQQLVGRKRRTPFTQDQLEKDIDDLVSVMRSGLKPVRR